ncbi:MAG: Glutathione S-transferase [Phenylobacterium sp.]|nr:Glutathione S-transferase [Phenylobacterium sp.]
MADELVFYTNPMSRGRIVRWMLEEVGQPYRTQVLGYADSMKSADYLAINPMGKVPALRHGDEVVTEGGAICAYLADAFPQAGLAPPLGDKKRAPYFRWMFFAAGPVEAVVTNKSLGYEPPADKKMMVGYGSYPDVMNALETALSKGDYVLGDKFSAADVYFGSHIGWGLQFGGIEKRPVFERYSERLRSRPASIRAAAIDDALIAAAAEPAPA